jgi:hypothetical protein
MDSIIVGYKVLLCFEFMRGAFGAIVRTLCPDMIVAVVDEERNKWISVVLLLLFAPPPEGLKGIAGLNNSKYVFITL